MDTGALSPGLKRPDCEAYHSHPFCAEVENIAAIATFPDTPSWRDAKLIKHRDNFTLLYFTFRLINFF
jgi:hypothetical protein